MEYLTSHMNKQSAHALQCAQELVGAALGGVSKKKKKRKQRTKFKSQKPKPTQNNKPPLLSTSAVQCAISSHTDTTSSALAEIEGTAISTPPFPASVPSRKPYKHTCRQLLSTAPAEVLKRESDVDTQNPNFVANSNSSPGQSSCCKNGPKGTPRKGKEVATREPGFPSGSSPYKTALLKNERAPACISCEERNVDKLELMFSQLHPCVDELDLRLENPLGHELAQLSMAQLDALQDILSKLDESIFDSKVTRVSSQSGKRATHMHQQRL